MQCNSIEMVFEFRVKTRDFLGAKTPHNHYRIFARARDP